MTDTSFKSVGILGCGIIGVSWAAFYAGRGLEVAMYDIDDEAPRNGLAKSRGYLDDLVRFGLLDGAMVQDAKERIRTVDSLARLGESADLVQESIIERYEAKKEVLAELEKHVAPSAIIASSSSGLLITEMQKALRSPERSLIAHPFNPPHMVPLVELVPGMQTNPAVMDKMRTFFLALGKVPITLRKEVSGHIANRLAAAVWREALHLVEQGVASAEDVDKALSAGPGIRWALMGQHLIYHLGGGDGGYEHFFQQFKPVFTEYWKDMAGWTEIPQAAQEAAIQGVRESLKDRSTQELAQWRDEKLAELIKVIYGQQKTHETG